MQTIAISDIYAKLKSKDDIINYFRELGKFIFITNTYRLILSKVILL